MANQGAKKRKDENKRHITMLLRLIIICNAVYILVRVLILHSSFTWKHVLGLLATSAAYGFPYLQLSNMAQPSYDENGDLFDGGFDMSTGGVCGSLLLLHINFSMFPRDSSRAPRRSQRMKKLVAKGRKWSGRLQDLNLLRQDPNDF